LGGTGTLNDDKHGVRIEGRMLPFPTSISPEAQAALRRLVGGDGIPLNARYTLPPADAVDAWTSIKSAANAQYAASVEGLADTPRAEIETIRLGETIIHIATPEANGAPDRLFIDLHGGTLVFGGGAACRAGAGIQADQHGVVCYGIDYRTPPEHPYPAALDDCLIAYRHALESHDPANIVIGGRSAGGNLAVAMVLRGRDEGLPLPAGLVLLSPEIDLTESGDSFEVNRMVDVVLPASLMAANRLYAGGADLSHPYLSPLFGDLAGLPPTFIQTGTRDLFLSNAARLHRALRRADVTTELHVFEGMPHGGFMGGTPEDRELADEIARFVAERWATLMAR
jgi:acetyl esterase/lipase